MTRPGKQARLTELDKQAASPDLWTDQALAQQTMRELASLREEIDPWLSVERRAQDALELLELASLEDDESVVHEVEKEAASLQKDVDALEFKLRLNGPYDRNDAYITITVGLGGVDAQDWAQMLCGCTCAGASGAASRPRLLDLAEGEEAGIKSVTFTLRGQYAYGYLRGERGVIVWCASVPFDQAHRRQTSFARVEVMPDVDDAADSRSEGRRRRVRGVSRGGQGGQNVNKVRQPFACAHPTGIVVTCADRTLAAPEPREWL